MEITATSADDLVGWAAYLASLSTNVPNWSDGKAKAVVAQFMRCRTRIDDLTACDVFVQNALASVFDVHDLIGKNANQIADYLALGPADWEKLGNGESQVALTRAQAEANNGKAVVAVWKNEDGPHGHIALIIPGVLRPSGPDYWDRLVPTAAQTSLNDVSGVWIGRPLSASFGPDKQEDVWLYVHQ